HHMHAISLTPHGSPHSIMVRMPRSEGDEDDDEKNEKMERMKRDWPSNIARMSPVRFYCQVWHMLHLRHFATGAATATSATAGAATDTPSTSGSLLHVRMQYMDM